MSHISVEDRQSVSPSAWCGFLVHRVLSTFLLVLIPLATVAYGESLDRIRRTRGQTPPGTITAMSRLAVTIERGSRERSVPVNEIRSILFADEPVELTQARTRAKNGSYDEALRLLADIRPADLDRDFMRQDFEYYRAYCEAKLALAGRGSLRDAGKRLTQFLQNHSDSFHYFAATEVVGDLLVAMGRYDRGQAQYEQLATAPWPELQMRAHVLTGRALQAQGKHTEAVAAFDEALAAKDNSPNAQTQRLTATLAKAVSLADLGQFDKGLAMITEVIADASPEDAPLQARAHIALGHCYRKANRQYDALLSFLYVDELCPTVADAHAEALFQLSELFNAVGQPNQARDARQRLQQSYPASRWAQ